MAAVVVENLTTVLTSMVREIKYQLLIGNTIKKFKYEMKLLIRYRDLVLKKVEAINKRTEIVDNSVLEWLNEVEKVMEEKEKMEIEIGADINVCFFNVKYKHGYYVDMRRNAQTLNEAAQMFFHRISIPILDIEYFYSGNIEWFKSTKEASELLLDALHDDSSYIVGLHGVRGSGKTALVKAVAQKAKILNIFGTIVFASVSQSPDVRKIQDEIADWLNLKLEENSETIRARIITLSLRSKKGVLVILDDVRAKLELEDIGIPCSEQCKVLLTTRSLQVCNSMECQREIPLHPLSEEESWIWFKRQSGIVDDSPSNLLNVAREVALECKGLPQTIKEVASSLKRKPIEEWEATLDSLRYSTAKYQVFLSFRGKDTRYSFTGYLYQALCREGLKTFMDDEGLQSGDQISQTLINLIKASKLSIVVFSQNYAFSTWCLDEIVTIVECMKTQKQLVWPIFYKVDPSDVRHQKNSYGEAMEFRRKRFAADSEKLQKWESALSEVANLSGEHFQTGYEYEFIHKIVKKTENVKNRLCIQSME